MLHYQADYRKVLRNVRECFDQLALKLKDPKGYHRLRRLPAFIFVRARKGIS
jgi:hypothetical protein